MEGDLKTLGREVDINKQLRTDNAIKNHFYSTLRKLYRHQNGVDPTNEELAAQVDLSHNDILANRLHGVSVHMVRTQISNCTIAENEGYAVYI